jgi:hypothetical protein
MTGFLLRLFSLKQMKLSLLLTWTRVQVQVSGARDLHLRQPLDQQGCKEEMDAIEIAAREASHVDPNNPMVPARTIVLANDRDALRALGLCMVGKVKKPFIE